MKKIRLILCFILAFYLCLPGISALETKAEAADGLAYDGYILKLKDGAGLLPLDESGMEEIAFTDGYYLADNFSEMQEVLDAGMVEYVEPNYILQLQDAVMPDDDLYAGQWALDLINFPNLHGSGYDGTGVTVAVIDSGIYTEHEDLSGVNISGYNFLGDSGISVVTAAYYRDQTGHGTFVTGEIAAQCNGLGISGIADGVSILALRCFSGTGDSTYAYAANYDRNSGTVAVIISAIGYAAEQGVDVISMSFGGTASTLPISLADAINSAAAGGAILVAASGNGGGTAYYWPASFDNVVSVGAVRDDETIASFSQHNDAVDVSAPGYLILGLDKSASYAYKIGSGTSYSVPIISALAAVVKQVDGALDTGDFLTILQSSVNDDAAGDGYDIYYGYGIVDASLLLDTLSAENRIIYETNGGDLTRTDVSSYTIDRISQVILSTPIKAASTFEGWYDNAKLTGTAVSVVPAGSVGDLTYYAKWDTSTAPSVAIGYEFQNGIAAPASYDALTGAVSYIESVSSWFTGPVNAYNVDTCDASGTVAISGSTLSYTPAAADAGSDVTLTVSASNQGSKSGVVTLTITVGMIPVSDSVVLDERVEYDLNAVGDLEIGMLLYGNTLFDLSLDSSVMMLNTNYTVFGQDVVTEEIVTLHESYLETLSTGDHTVTFTFSSGRTAPYEKTLGLRITDSTVYHTVMFMNDGSQYRQVTGVASGSTVTLPTEPTKNSYTFGGWYTGENGSGTEFTSGTEITFDVIVYAYWISSGGGGGGDGDGYKDVTTIVEIKGDDTDDAGNLALDVDKLSQFLIDQIYFNDVRESDWYYDAIMYVTGKGLFLGATDTSFNPKGTITRAMLVTVLWRLAGEPEAAGENPFTDLQENLYYYQAVLWVSQHGIASGLGDSRFDPNAPIIRENMVLLLWKYAQFKGFIVQGYTQLSKVFSDADKVDFWAEPALGWAVDAGFISGTTDTTLSPQSTATRAEVATILKRYCMTLE